MTALALPLTQTQLNAANRLHGRLPHWVATDKALVSLALAFPHWSLEACLLKVAAVNQLYGTNLYAVVRMAEHVSQVMATAIPAVEGAALVERIAALPTTPGQSRPRHHYSFASKLAHFFIDAERFPIYDSYAVQMVERHLGPQQSARDAAHPYLAYVANLARLRGGSDLTWAGRELDRYLWLAGQYRAWRKNPEALINTEVAQLFRMPGPAADDLATLLPTPTVSTTSENPAI